MEIQNGIPKWVVEKQFDSGMELEASVQLETRTYTSFGARRDLVWRINDISPESFCNLRVLAILSAFSIHSLARICSLVRWYTFFCRLCMFQWIHLNLWLSFCNNSNARFISFCGPEDCHGTTKVLLQAESQNHIKIAWFRDSLASSTRSSFARVSPKFP